MKTTHSYFRLAFALGGLLAAAPAQAGPPHVYRAVAEILAFVYRLSLEKGAR